MHSPLLPLQRLPRKAVRSTLLCLGFLWVMGGLSGNAEAQDRLESWSYPNLGNSQVTLSTYFGKAASHGATPYLLTFQNRTGQDRPWTVTLRESYPGRSQSPATHTFLIPAHSTESHLIHSHNLMDSPDYYTAMNIGVSTPGESPRSHYVHESFDPGHPTLALSKDLAEKSLVRLNDALQKSSRRNRDFGHSYDPATLPENWLSYTSLDYLLIDLPAWQSLRSGQKAAILTWVGMGGHLAVYTTEEDTPLSVLNAPPFAHATEPLTDSDTPEQPHGLGAASLRWWNGESLPDTVIQQYEEPEASLAWQGEHRYRNNTWGLREALPPMQRHFALVLVILILFSILVGPFNLFVLAGRGRRQRLFLTTPLISLGACLLIVAFIFLKDGIGGHGMRTVLVDLQTGHGQPAMIVTQEQLSQTGVMLSSGFSADQALRVLPVNARNARDPFKPNSRNLHVSNTQYQGSFFRSRSEQGYLLQTVMPTRARIELAPVGENGDTPALVSNLPGAISGFFYMDDEGTIWRQPEGQVTPSGGKIPLEKSDETALQDWLDTRTRFFSQPRKKQISQLAGNSGRFFATLEPSETLFLPTHPSINWRQEMALLTGTPPSPSARP